jgi:hypothetical protein
MHRHDYCALTNSLAILFELQHIRDKYLPALAPILIFLHSLLPVLPESLTSLELGPPYLRLKPFLLLRRPPQ